VPKHDRPKYERVDLYLPPALVEAARREAGDAGLTAWIGGLVASAAGVSYTPPKRGRPAKPRPARKPRKEKDR
jgi:hypothetical protein